jgi:medium-chain acyl-[acyl-carrier-protein] hydrolase
MLTRLNQEYYLRALDVDIKGKWMPSAVFVRMQEIAEDHATAAGLGRADLIEKQGYAWVLTRIHLKMKQYPNLAETIHVSTWPLKPTKLTFLRQFQFTDQQGRELGSASSQWVLFDIRDRVIRRTNMIGDYPYDPEAQPALEEPGKIILPKDMPNKAARTVMYSDVDMNGHMNNTKYLNWICELFDSEFLQKKELETVRLNYIAEPYIDQKVDLYMKQVDGSYYICGKTAEKTVFDSLIKWTDVKG